MTIAEQHDDAKQAYRPNYSIAMATFNGEVYIREQLDSLAKQILLPFELVVCDDGSSDGTVDILQEFGKKAPFPVKIHQNPQQLGFADNFLQAARGCSGEWVAFCDQDDVWFPEKLLSVSEAIRNTQTSDLMLVTHSVQMATQDLFPRNATQSHSHKTKDPEGKRWSAAALGGVKTVRSRNDKTIGPNGHPGFWVLPGFTCVFRTELITCFDWKVRPKSYDGSYPLQTHDKWICMLANALGSVHHIAKPLVLYRRHGAAVTGSYETKSLGERIALSRRVGAERYGFMALVARESASVLKTFAQSTANPKWSEKLMHSGILFEKLASNCAMRADIYRRTTLGKRFTAFIRLVASRGYFGNAFYSLGMSSFLKDMVCCFARRPSTE